MMLSDTVYVHISSFIRSVDSHLRSCESPVDDIETSLMRVVETFTELSGVCAEKELDMLQ